MAVLLKWTFGKLAMPFALYSSISSFAYAIAAEDKAEAAETRALDAERRGNAAEGRAEEAEQRLRELARLVAEGEAGEMMEEEEGRDEAEGRARPRPAAARFVLSIGPECVICMTNQREVLFESCRHVIVCRSCAERMEARGDRHCPICRQETGQTSRIFQ